MPEQSLKNLTREEYHYLRRTRHAQLKTPVRLLKCWEPVRLRHIHHYWSKGKRLHSLDLPPGHYQTRVIDCRMKSYDVMLWDVEVLKPVSMPNIQQVPYKSELGTLLKEAYSKHLKP